jgi:hypothetical protein
MHPAKLDSEASPMIRLLLFIISLMWVSACNSESVSEDKPVKDSVSVCTSLDSVFSALKNLNALLADTTANWAGVKPSLDLVLDGLQANEKADDSGCHFLDARIHPEIERFSFVEHLRRRIVRDTISDGIYYLVRFRGIFTQDNEIQEFFSEEIAHVAYRNPESFILYLRRDPGQKEMLLNTTRWSVFKEDSLIARFSKVKGGESVSAFIQKLKDSKPEAAL